LLEEFSWKARQQHVRLVHRQSKALGSHPLLHTRIHPACPNTCYCSCPSSKQRLCQLCMFVDSINSCLNQAKTLLVIDSRQKVPSTYLLASNRASNTHGLIQARRPTQVY
jgi:hypothetical protein